MPKTSRTKPRRPSVRTKKAITRVTAVKTRARKTPTKKKRILRASAPTLTFERFEENPIITPNELHPWESKATFNPAAVMIDDKVHLLYRAVGEGDTSGLGYAASVNGFDIDEQLPHPAYVRGTTGHASAEPVFPVCYASGGGWNGGCEDPRLALLGDRVYLLYTAFDGWGSIRIALSSIPRRDFEHKIWNWSAPVFISPPHEVHKNWVLFPEKINGKYAILHSISPVVLVDYVDDLKEFDGTKFINSFYHARSGRKEAWDNWVRGVGPTPIKTEYGWLILYHAMDDSDPNRYKLGAMLLDLKDPTKVLYRAKSPFLEPDECYENEGFKAGVIYCCGAVVSGERLLIYYGGADMVTCVASVNLKEFLNELITTGTPTVQKKGAQKRIIKKKE